MILEAVINQDNDRCVSRKFKYCSFTARSYCSFNDSGDEWQYPQQGGKQEIF